MSVALVLPPEHTERLEQRVSRGNLGNAFSRARTVRTPSINRTRTISARLQGRRRGAP